MRGLSIRPRALSAAPASPQSRFFQAFGAALLLLSGSAHGQTQTDRADAMRLPPASLHEQVLNVPGAPQNPVLLEVTLYEPPGRGPFPLAVMNHGATNANADNRGERYRFTFSAYYFLSRGYAVALPMMRGFAGSGGNIVHRGCDLAAVGIANAQDIRAVIDALAARPEIDTSHTVAAGQSFGGWNTLALGTLGDSRVKGLINFSGGIRTSDCSTQDASLIATSAYLGAHTKVPSIWFYGDNDKVFPVATWRGMYARYTHAGGQAELVAYGSFMSDAHQLLSYPESLPLWTPKVDAFLRSIGMPGGLLFPDYLPTPAPPPTHYAPVDDVAAVPYLNERARALYRAFLGKPFPRAFVIAPNGGAAGFDGGFDPLARALRACQGHPGCSAYAVDDEVVWTRPDAAALARAEAPPTIAKVVASGMTTTLDFSYSVNPDCTLRALPQLSLTQPPTHGAATISTRSDYPRFPPNTPYAACDAVKVRGTVLDYTPARGFTGSDSLVFETAGPDGRHRVYRIALTIR